MAQQYLTQALNYINNTDLNTLPLGKHIIDEGNIWVNIIEAPLRKAEDAILEAHDVFIDIHIPLSGSETYKEWPRCLCLHPKGEINTDDDIIFFEDNNYNLVTKNAGEITIYKPDTAHAPLIGEGKLKKAIFKVRG